MFVDMLEKIIVCVKSTHQQQVAPLYFPLVSQTPNLMDQDYVLLPHIHMPPSVFLTTQSTPHILFVKDEEIPSFNLFIHRYQKEGEHTEILSEQDASISRVPMWL
jgi:hypothetical protein